MGISQVGGSSLSTPSTLLLENATLQQTITSGSGTLTLSKPSWILMAGGGGAGGATLGNGGTNYGGGGGGSGGILGFWAPSGTYTYSVGAGGSAVSGGSGSDGSNTYIFKEVGTNQGYGWMACGGGGGAFGFSSPGNTGNNATAVSNSSLSNVYFQYVNGGGGGGSYNASNGTTPTQPSLSIVTQTSTTSFPIHLISPHLASNLYSSFGSKAAAWFSQGGHTGQASPISGAPSSHGTYLYNICAHGGSAGGTATFGGTAENGGVQSINGAIKASDLTRLAGQTTAKVGETSGSHRYGGGGVGGNGILAAGATPTSTAVGGNGGQGGGGGGGAGGVTVGASFSGGSGGSGCILVWN
jgi:hypothetical protein